MRKKFIVFLLLALILSGCASPQTKALYYRMEPNYLFKDEDIQKYKEIKIVDSLSQLEENLQKPVAVWIDMYAMDSIPDGWLQESPQKDYPIAVIGYNEPVHIFGTLLPVDFPWPKRDPVNKNMPAGFSVWKRTGEQNGIIQGYSQLSIELVLEVTNKLLNNEVP